MCVLDSRAREKGPDANPDPSDVAGDGSGDVRDPVDGGMLHAKAFEVARRVQVAIRDGGTTVLQSAWPAAECLDVAILCSIQARALTRRWAPNP